jgi:hypothetical protein
MIRSKAASVGGLTHSIIMSRRAIRSCKADYDSTLSLVNKVKDVSRRLKPFQTSACGPIRFRFWQFLKEAENQRIVVSNVT